MEPNSYRLLYLFTFTSRLNPSQTDYYLIYLPLSNNICNSHGHMTIPDVEILVVRFALCVVDANNEHYIPQQLWLHDTPYSKSA